MGADADLLIVVARAHFEFQLAAIDFGQLGLGENAMANGRGGEMLQAHSGPHTGFAGLEIGLHGIQRGIFHEQHHHWRRKHRRQDRILELAGEMERLHDKRVRALGSDRYRAHDSPLSFGIAGPEPYRRQLLKTSGTLPSISLEIELSPGPKKTIVS